MIPATNFRLELWWTGGSLVAVFIFTGNFAENLQQLLFCSDCDWRWSTGGCGHKPGTTFTFKELHIVAWLVCIQTLLVNYMHIRISHLSQIDLFFGKGKIHTSKVWGILKYTILSKYFFLVSWLILEFPQALCENSAIEVMNVRFRDAFKKKLLRRRLWSILIFPPPSLA